MTTRQRLETLQRLGRQATIVAAMLWLIFGVLQHGYRLQWVRGQDALHIAADAAVVAAYAFGIAVRFLLFRQAGKSTRRIWIDLFFLTINQQKNCFHFRYFVRASSILDTSTCLRIAV